MNFLPRSRGRLRIGAYNGFVLAGALVNIIVVMVLLVHWAVR